jgi:hypothetical protein
MPVSGTSFAPSLTLITLAGVAAHIARLVAPRDSPHVFATVSNGALLCAGLLCPLDDGALAVMLAGAASLAFHAEYALGAYAHTLDIALGWVLVAHLAFAPLLAGARFVARNLGITDESPLSWLRVLGRIAIYAVLGTAFVLMFALYDSVYHNDAVGGNGQLVLYLICAPVAALALVVERVFVLTQPPPAQRTGLLHPYAEAALETAVLLLVLAAAVTAQGELLGRSLTAKKQPAEYDLFHGQWHVLIAVVAAVAYQRSYDVNRLARRELESCVCRSDASEVALLGGLGGYAVLVIVLKEAGEGAGAGAGASEAVLGVAMLGLVGLSGAAWWRDAAQRRKWVEWRGRAAFATVGNSNACRFYTWNLHDALQPAHAQLWVVP